MTPTRKTHDAVAAAMAAVRTEVPGQAGSVLVHDALVRDTARRLDQSGVVERIEQWAAADAAGAGGRPELFPKRALLVVMFVCARLEKPMLASVWLDLMCHALSPAMRAELGIPAPPDAEDLQAWDAYYRNVRTRFHAIETLMDYSLYPKNRRYSAEEMVDRLRDLTPQRIETLRDRQTWFINKVVQISHTVLPRELWRRWSGGLAVDATPLGTFARHAERTRAKKNRQIVVHSADPDAGWYVKEGDHSDTDTGVTKLLWGYEHTLVFAGATTKAERGLFPKLLLGIAPPHRPGESPGRNGRTAVTEAHAATATAGTGPRLLAGDNAYVNATPADYAQPLRRLGLELVQDYNRTQTGLQGSHEGALLVDGRWYCPAMPPLLISATTDHRADRIDYDTWQRRLADRRSFELRPKAKPEPDGSVRMLCPAAGIAPTARCDLKPASNQRRHQANRRVDLTHLLEQNPPKVCRQQSITITPEARGRFEQPLRHGTEEWRVAYQTLRSTNEGGNGIAKDAARQNIEDPRRRRIRGQAANALITAFQHCAENIRLILSYAHKATADSEGDVQLTYSPRKPKKVSTETAAPVPATGDPPRPESP